MTMSYTPESYMSGLISLGHGDVVVVVVVVAAAVVVVVVAVTEVVVHEIEKQV